VVDSWVEQVEAGAYLAELAEPAELWELAELGDQVEVVVCMVPEATVVDGACLVELLP
jgi:hypothetical protein